MNVVARAREDRVRAGADNEKQVAGRAAVHTGVAFRLQANPLAVARAGLDAKLDRLAPADQAFAVAGGAEIGRVPGAVAARAGNIELHAPAHLRHLARAFAFRALRRPAAGRLSMAGGARLLTVHFEPRLATANRRPEVYCGLVFEIGARLWAARTLRLVRPAENAGKDIFEAAPRLRTRSRLLAWMHPRPALEAGKVEAAEVHRHTA